MGDPPRDNDGAPDRPDWKRAYTDVARIPEFRSLWLAHALSMAGGYLLSIAVVTLVYQQTSSPLAAGVTVALTFIPPVIAGPLLSALSDLLPRRRVMIASDVARAALVFGIGVPGLPLWAIWTLLFCSVLPMVPFGAARAALMTEIVRGERYVAASTTINLTTHVGTLVGLIAGGWVVSQVGPNQAVMINGVTFLVSAAIIRLSVRDRPVPAPSGTGRPGLWKFTREGTLVVFRDPRLRTLALLAWLAGFYMVPYGLAGPLAEASGGSAFDTGLLMAAPSIGALIGGFVLTRLIGPETRMRLIGPLAIGGSVPLLVWAADPPLWGMVLLLVLSGALSAYQLVANAAFVLCAPAEGRGLAFGLVAAGLQAVQGIGIAAASLLVEIVDLRSVITGAGLLGVLGALLLTAPWARLTPEALSRMNASERPA